VQIEIYDPSIFVDFEFAKDKPVSLSGAAQCLLGLTICRTSRRRQSRRGSASSTRCRSIPQHLWRNLRQQDPGEVPMTRSHAVVLNALAAILSACTGIMSAWSAPFGAPHPPTAMPASSLTAWIFAEQTSFYRSLSGFIRASKEDGTAMWELFGISFVYGVFHAVGPGHGKAVISSYLVANEETWLRGVVLSFLSAAIQSAVAIIVEAIAAILLGATAKSIGLTVRLVEITSYALVILIGLRLFYVKGRGFLIACRELTWHQATGLAFASAPVAKSLSASSFRLSEGWSGAVAMRGGQTDAPLMRAASSATTIMSTMNQPGATPMGPSRRSSQAQAAGGEGWPRWSRSDCGPVPARSSC
jgi:nickel/cobalt exporter